MKFRWTDCWCMFETPLDYIGALVMTGLMAYGLMSIVDSYRKPKKVTQAFIPMLSFPWSKEERELSQLINSYRKEHGLNTIIPEKMHWQLAFVRNYTNMERNTLSHDSMFSDLRPLMDCGLKVGELLAYKHTTPESTFEAWKRSETHNKAMLNKDFSFFGVSIVGKYTCAVLSRK